MVSSNMTHENLASRVVLVLGSRVGFMVRVSRFFHDWALIKGATLEGLISERWLD